MSDHPKLGLQHLQSAHCKCRKFADLNVKPPCSTAILLCRPGGSLLCVSAGEQVGSLHGWNQIELLCIGERVRIVSNGVLVTDWTDPDPSLVAAGPIALQLHKMDPGMVRRPPRLALGFFGLLRWVFND